MAGLPLAARPVCAILIPVPNPWLLANASNLGATARAGKAISVTGLPRAANGRAAAGHGRRFRARRRPGAAKRAAGIHRRMCSPKPRRREEGGPGIPGTTSRRAASSSPKAGPRTCPSRTRCGRSSPQAVDRSRGGGRGSNTGARVRTLLPIAAGNPRRAAGSNSPRSWGEKPSRQYASGSIWTSSRSRSRGRASRRRCRWPTLTSARCSTWSRTSSTRTRSVGTPPGEANPAPPATRSLIRRIESPLGGQNHFTSWIDREKQAGAVLMTQMLPGLDPGPRKLLEDIPGGLQGSGPGDGRAGRPGRGRAHASRSADRQGLAAAKRWHGSLLQNELENRGQDLEGGARLVVLVVWERVRPAGTIGVVGPQHLLHPDLVRRLDPR